MLLRLSGVSRTAENYTETGSLAATAFIRDFLLVPPYIQKINFCDDQIISVLLSENVFIS